MAEGDAEIIDATLASASSSRGTRASSLRSEAEDHRDTVKHKLELQWGRCKKNVAAQVSSTLTSGEKAVVDNETRQAVVKDLYPRFLYTFSDVVCYVTNNPK